MNKTKKPLSIILAVIMCVPFALTAFADTTVDHIISNPYANVDWDTVNTYKTALHTHTNASDGDCTLRESVERHVETDFDIVATTDHGTVNYTWAEANPNKFIHGVMSIVGKSEGELDYIGYEGTFGNGISYTYGTAENGDDYLVLDNGKNILRVPYGIENNAVSVNAHVNSWFVDHCDNTITQYEDAVKGVDKLGGVSIINHPGEYTKARYELHTEDAYNENNFAYGYYINKYASLIEKYDSCLGIDMNSKGDNRTRFDRKLWDILLTRFAKNGENVFGIASSDAHQLNVINTGFTLLLMPDKTSEYARAALENGEFFAASHCLGNYDELVDIAAAIKEYYGETELYNKVNESATAMADRVAAIESGDMPADEDISITYKAIDDNGFDIYDTFPSVKSVSVDDSEDTITIDTENALIIRWISNGKLIATQKADGTAFDINDYEDVLGDYVRAEIFGEGGMIYSQAFLLDAESKAGTSKVTGFYFNAGVFDFLFAILNNWKEIIVRFFSSFKN